jgi:imidazole glycerol-phosphate synthase subunit HisF
MKPRIIPVLLLDGEDAVKTIGFSSPRYVGDILNAVQIFNDKLVDELFVLDISANRGHEKPSRILLELAQECFMPLGFAGGMRNVKQMSNYFAAGFEKLAINTAFHHGGSLVREAADLFGSQSVLVSIDAKRRAAGHYEVLTHNGTQLTGLDPVTQAKRAEDQGAGEIVLQSIDRDGGFCGYDIELVKMVASAVGIPVVAAGGAASVQDLWRVQYEGGASAAAAGSMFVFHGPHKAVLITYKTPEAVLASAT